MNNLNLSQDDVRELFYGNTVFTDPDTEEVELYRRVSKEVEDTNSEKGSVTYQVVIEHIPTGKLYRAYLGESPWYMQQEHNAEQTWIEVTPKKKTITVYE